MSFTKEGSCSSSTEVEEALRRVPTETDEERPRRRGSSVSRVQSRVEEEDALSRVLSGNETFSGPLPPMGPDGVTIPAAPPNQEVYRVQVAGEDDPDLPTNWTRRRQLISGIALTFATLVVSWGSAVYGAAMPHIEAQFHIGITPAALGISLYVLGFALGPIVWGPMSEQLGRKMPLTLGIFLFTCFTFATATAKDVQTIMICRFFSGAVGASTFSIVPAIFADMFPAKTRGRASALFTLAVNGGPMVSPVVGAYIVYSYLSWRWTLYITGIGAGLALFGIVFFYEETYMPLILSRRAAMLRKRTGNWAIYAPHDRVELDFNAIVTNTLLRPMKMLVSEPILLLLSLYNGFVYALLYMCLEAIPIVFRGYEFKGGNIMLPYLSVLVGSCIAIFSNLFIFEPMYVKALSKSRYPVVPEARLPLMMTGAIFFLISIFWVFWTGAYPKTPEHPHGVHWIAPVIALAFFGYGFVALFLPIINYILDCYLMLAASAMAGNTFLRSMMAAAFPLFTTQMFTNLGIQWAGTLIGCLAAVMTPVPFLFYKYGATLRTKSKFAFNLEDNN